MVTKNMKERETKMARKLTFNKSNWSGEEATLRITNKNTFKMFGDEYRLEVSDFDEDMKELKIVRKQDNEAVITGLYWPKYDKGFVTMMGGSLDRGAKIEEFGSLENAAIVAAVQVMYNIY
jgi:hypothetical protein